MEWSASSRSVQTQNTLLTEVKAYKATSVQRLPSRQGAPSLAVRLTFACEALPCRVKVGLQMFVVTPTRHACGGVPAAKNSITPQCFANKAYRSVHGAGDGITKERGVVPLPPAQTARAQIAPNSYYTTTPQPTDLHTQPHNPHMQASPKTNNKQQHTKQLAMQTVLDRVGLQTAHRQKQLRPPPNKHTATPPRQARSKRNARNKR